MLFYNHFRRLINGAPSISLLDFRRQLAEKLIQAFQASTVDPCDSSSDDEHSSKRLRSNGQLHHTLAKAPAYTGKWKNGTWSAVSTRYYKRLCAGPGCKSKIREHCACDPTRFWCGHCFYTTHSLE